MELLGHGRGHRVRDPSKLFFRVVGLVSSVPHQRKGTLEDPDGLEVHLVDTGRGFP